MNVKISFSGLLKHCGCQRTEVGIFKTYFSPLVTSVNAATVVSAVAVCIAVLQIDKILNWIKYWYCSCLLHEFS